MEAPDGVASLIVSPGGTSVLKIPAVKGHLHLAVIPGEGVLVLAEDTARALCGEAYEKVVPLIDGRRTADEIVDALAGKVDAAEAYYVLYSMQAKGYLAEAAALERPLAAYWSAAGVEPSAAAAALAEKQVAVEALGETDAAPMLAALEGCGVRPGAAEGAALLVVVTDDYVRPELARINDRALQGTRPWLLVRPAGPELWLGPLFKPCETGCWECLRVRLERNRPAHRFVAEKQKLDAPPLTARGALPATRAAAFQMAAAAAAQFIAGAPTGLSGKVLSLDWTTHAAQTHPLLRHPYCRTCGEPQRQELRPVGLKAGKALFVRDGGHRSVAPEETIRKYEHLVSPITGVVRVLARARPDDPVAPVYFAGHNGALRLERLEHLKRGLRSGSAGKGMSEAQARASALCEALERYSGEANGTELRCTRRLREWSDAEAMHPNRVMLYSERQFAERERWNARKSRFNVVPEPLDEAQLIDWTPLWSLTEKRHKYLPTQLLYFRSPATRDDRRMFCMGCSNGNAAGNTLEEAILQGFFELVERDATAIWWYNRLRRPAVDVESFGETALVEMVEHYRQRFGRETWALDLTSDLGIPAFVALSRRAGEEQERIFLGLGCHFDARIALLRAFGEMSQMLAYDDPHAEDAQAAGSDLEDEETLRWLRTATLASHPYLAPDPAAPARRLHDFPQQHSGDLLEDIGRCRAIIEARGMEMLVLDQTRRDVGLPVAKVVVPGLRHFWARYAPGRLYDVPVQMGWLERPLREDELNPVPMFL